MTPQTLARVSALLDRPGGCPDLAAQAVWGARVPAGDLTQAFGRLHSLHHAAPEQVTGEPTGVATDVWALGVLLYELVCGERPFPGASRGAIEAAIRHRAPRAPGAVLAERAGGALPQAMQEAWRALDAIVLKALSKEVGRRHASAAALRGELLRWLRRAAPAAGAWVLETLDAPEPHGGDAGLPLHGA